MKNYKLQYLAGFLTLFTMMNSCKKNSSPIINQVETKTLSKSADTVITEYGIYLLSPDALEIDSLKKNKGEENFYTIADDSNFYISKISDLSKNPLININKKSINFKNENFIFRKKDSKNSWIVIDYTSGSKPVEYSLVDYYDKIKNAPQNTNKAASNIDKYLKNDDFFSVDLDINNDGFNDKIFSHKVYKGDSLLIFFKEKENYILKLSSVNLSQDGGQEISEIIKNDKGFSLITAFPKGNDKYNYFLYYKNDDFIIEKVNHTIESWQNNSKKECNFSTNVSLKQTSSQIFEKLVKSENEKK